MTQKLYDGFTVVELLVAIVIAVLILGAGGQVYSVALTNAGTSQRRAKASNVAYDLLRQAQSPAPPQVVTTPCTASGPTSITVPATAALPGATATQTISCPFTDQPTISKISVTVSYNNPETRSVTRAILATP